MTYHFLGWTFWAIALAMHAIWWAWIAPPIKSRLRVIGKSDWQYFHILPYLTTLSLVFWPFLALDKIQNWAPTDSKSIIATIYVFSLEAFVIFACLTKLFSVKNNLSIFNDIAAKVSMGRCHKIQECFAPHGAAFFCANFLAVSALYSFVISPSEAKAKANTRLDTGFENSVMYASDMAPVSGEYYAGGKFENAPSIVAMSAAQNNDPNGAQNGATGIDKNGNTSRIIGADGQIIEGEIIGANASGSKVSATAGVPDAAINNQTNSAIENKDADHSSDSTAVQPSSNTPVLHENRAQQWQLIDASPNYSSETSAVAEIGKSANLGALSDSFLGNASDTPETEFNF